MADEVNELLSIGYDPADAVRTIAERYHVSFDQVRENYRREYGMNPEDFRIEDME